MDSRWSYCFIKAASSVGIRKLGVFLVLLQDSFQVPNPKICPTFYTNKTWTCFEDVFHESDFVDTLLIASFCQLTAPSPGRRFQYWTPWVCRNVVSSNSTRCRNAVFFPPSFDMSNLPRSFIAILCAVHATDWRGWGLGHGFSWNFAANRQEKRPTPPFSGECGKASDWNAKELMNSASCRQVPPSKKNKNMPWALRHFTVLTLTKVGPLLLLSFLLDGFGHFLILLLLCLNSHGACAGGGCFQKGNQGFCSLFQPLSTVPREVWYWNDSCHKVIKVNGERCSFQGWDKFGIKCTWYSNLWNAVWDMKSARKWLVWFLCRQGKDVLSLGVRNGWKEFGIFGRRLLCNVSVEHENRHWTGEDFSLLSTSFRGQRCLWRKFPCAHHALHV